MVGFERKRLDVRHSHEGMLGMLANEGMLLVLSRMPIFVDWIDLTQFGQVRTLILLSGVIPITFLS